MVPCEGNRGKTMADLVRLAERIALILMSGYVVWQWLPQFGPHPQVILVLASELVAVFFLLIQRKGQWSSSAYTTAIAFGGTAASLCVLPGGTALAPDYVTAPLIMLVTAIALAAKLSLSDTAMGEEMIYLKHLSDADRHLLGEHHAYVRRPKKKSCAPEKKT